MPSPRNFGEIESISALKALSFYEILGVSPQSTQAQIRDAYRRKSKQYHPDTAVMEKAEAKIRFQAVNQAYDTLRFPEKRQQYDALLIKAEVKRRSRSPVAPKASYKNATAFLDPEDRPLSAGEIFALFILGLTFAFCLVVALFLGISRGEVLVQSIPPDSSLLHQIELVRGKAFTTGTPTTSSKDKPAYLSKAAPKHPAQSMTKRTQKTLFPPVASSGATHKSPVVVTTP